MLQRLIVSIIATAVLALGTVALWRSLSDDRVEQVARIAEAESWAARSQLVRRVDALLSALRNVSVFWAAYGHLPVEQWAADAGVELEHFEGLTLLVWDDPARGARYSRTSEHNSLSYRPEDEEWSAYQALIARARAAGGNAMSGPYKRADGSAYFEVYIVNPRSGPGGTLAAIVDTRNMLAGFLRDDSPGYAIQVYSGEILLYERGTPDTDAPATWTREGLIRSSLNTLWRVVHMPTPELVASFERPAVNMILLLGLTISLLVGAVTFENSRARSRALAAESAERRLAELNRSLEHEVAERTADLQTLTDSVAHDLRNPLNAIAMNVQLLEAEWGERASADGADTLARISRSVKQTKVICERLLGLSKVSHSTFERSHFEVRPMVESVIDDLLVAEPPPPVRIDIADLPAVSADKTMVEMLFINLLSNALKYTRKADARRISVAYLATDDGHAFCIRDNGIGFDPDCAERLFVAFDRLDGSATAEGVGLGLTIAARVVQRHGGRIWAEGQPGQGAAFYFTLGPHDGEGRLGG